MVTNPLPSLLRVPPSPTLSSSSSTSVRGGVAVAGDAAGAFARLTSPGHAAPHCQQMTREDERRQETGRCLSTLMSFTLTARRATTSERTGEGIFLPFPPLSFSAPIFSSEIPVLSITALNFSGISEESGGSGCECIRRGEGETEQEQESSVPGTKEKGNRRGLGGRERWLLVGPLPGGFISDTCIT
ncbi:hypothetical protein WMY93_018678 [Mugilogobius chulae]|uniref:Uncharacterized protein n=1 Tax=Mugilogobius chulae TaxID=88201 RepID=A0AAW0NNV5_9GOBI